MKRLLGLLAGGLVCAWLQGTLAGLAPAHWLPDLVLLWAIGGAVAVPIAEALVVAATLGYAADVLSGALLGQHALLLVVACAATRGASVQLHLARTAARLTLVVGLSVLYHAGHAGLVLLFADGEVSGGLLLRHAAVPIVLNALVGPAVLALAEGWAELLGREEEGVRRPPRLRGAR